MEDYGLERKGKRGNYDMAVLSPRFVRANGIESVINKDIRDLEERARDREAFRSELITAIEFKYVDSRRDIVLVEKDTAKLTYSLKHQDFEVYNLVFCNLRYHYLDDLKETITATGYSESRVRSLLAVSYLEGSGKVTPKPLTNGWDF